jgi:hypothetical protein
MTQEASGPRELAPLGEGCECVSSHSPAAYVPTRHHIVPQSWDGPNVDANLITICPNTHEAVHRLLDTYVRNGGLPDWETRRHFSNFQRELAARAWLQRPEHPTLTAHAPPKAAVSA